MATAPDFDPAFLERAVDLAALAVEEGTGGPFGALVIKDGVVIAEGRNRVTVDHDPTAHAEVVAIRAACRAVGAFQLDGCVVYSSCEPCPMCLGAIYWSRPAAVFYAATREDAALGGFDDSLIYDELALPQAERIIPFRQVDSPGAAEIFQRWRDHEDRIHY